MVTQGITFYQVISSIGVIFTIIGVWWAISRQIKKDRDEFATKEYVKQKIETMDNKICVVEKDIAKNRDDNIREHSIIKDDITKHFDKRFDDFKDFMKELIKAS